MLGLWLALERSDLGHHRPAKWKTAAGWLKPVPLPSQDWLSKARG